VQRRLALVSLLSALLANHALADRSIHVVRSGDSLGALALRYGVSVVDLRAWNDLDDDTIQVGQELAVEPGAVMRYRTVPGDTLSCIADRFGVPVSRLREDNRALSRGLTVGMSLRIVGGRDPRAEPSRRVHRVAAGERLARIARRYDVEPRQIIEWNPGLRPDRLRVGQELEIRGGGRSESVGSATCGFIRGPVALGPHPAYVLRNRSRAYATQRTVDLLREGFDHVRRSHPNAARVRVHDLSLPGGGAIDDHRSHQSGRDVDITYYRRGGCGPAGCPLARITPDQLDVRRQWTLLHHWLRRGVVEAIYVDRSLHEVLYREAERRGATRAELSRWFQYPRGANAADGLVRHFPNHADHVHVRFACAPGDHDCR
jgi:LysM repeat protein